MLDRFDVALLDLLQSSDRISRERRDDRLNRVLDLGDCSKSVQVSRRLLTPRNVVPQDALNAFSEEGSKLPRMGVTASKTFSRTTLGRIPTNCGLREVHDQCRSDGTLAQKSHLLENGVQGSSEASSIGTGRG